MRKKETRTKGYHGGQLKQVLGHELGDQVHGNDRSQTSRQKLVAKAQYQFSGKIVSTIATWECVPLH